MKNFWIILIGVIIGAISYWFNSYNDLYFLGIHIWILMGVGAFLGAILSRLLFLTKTSKSALFLTLGILISVLLRIIYDITFWDPTSHNLAPFEIIIAALITLPASFLGSFLAKAFVSDRRIN